MLNGRCAVPGFMSLSESHCKDTTFLIPNSPMLIVAPRYSTIITDKYQGSPKWKKI